MSGKNQRIPATQSPDFFPLAGLEEELALLHDGSLVAVLEVEAADFALLSQEEKEGLIDRYAQVLKGLDFPVDVYVGVREQEIQGYLDFLTDRYQAMGSSSSPQGEFFRSCLWQHVRFLEGMVTRHIHSPYVLCGVSTGRAGLASGLLRGLKALAQARPGTKPAPGSLDKDLRALPKEGRALDLRVEKLVEGLKRLGLACRRLSGQELAREIGRLTRPGSGGVLWEPAGEALVVQGESHAR